MAEKRSAGARLWALAHLVTPMAIRVAATLRIADRLAERPRTAAELAGEVGADAGALERLLRHLAAKEVLARDAAGRYALAPLGEPLRSGHPDGLRDMLDVTGAVGRAELCLVHLLHSVRTGEAAYPVQFGRSFWADLAADPELAASFDARMGADLTATRAPDIVAARDWGALGHVVDVGGGDGSLLIALLRAYPGLRGTLLDLPGTAETARKALARAGLAHRAEVVAGSFFDPLPRRGGAYLLSSVLHDWDDGSAVAILRRCAEAAGAGGTVHVIERIGADGGSPGTAMDLRMLAYYGGRERTAAELAELGRAAGLEPIGVRPAGRSSIIEFTVPQGSAGARAQGDQPWQETASGSSGHGSTT